MLSQQARESSRSTASSNCCAAGMCGIDDSLWPQRSVSGGLQADRGRQPPGDAAGDRAGLAGSCAGWHQPSLVTWLGCHHHHCRA